jgi:hypothetical protein
MAKKYMKKYWLLPLLLFLCCTIAAAQKIQYSKPLINMPADGDFKLVADIGGFHHLIHLAVNTKPSINIYNNQLHLQETIELNFKLPEKCDIRLLKLKGYYILYVHPSRTSNHYFTKITGNGLATDISNLTGNPEDSIWNKATTAFQLFDIENNLALLSHTYIKEVKKIRTAIIKPGLNGAPATVKHLFFPFQSENEELKEITFKNNYLHVLKTSKDEDGNNTLTVYKIDIANNKLLFRHFDSGKYLYYKPSFRISDDGKTSFVYATITVPSSYKGSKPGVFVTKLDSVLNEISPAKTIPDIYKGNTASIFMVERTATNGWINFSYIPKINERPPPVPQPITVVVDYINFDPSLNSISSLNNYSYVYTPHQAPSAVRITVLNNDFQKVQDSLIKNKGSYYKIHPTPFAQFTLQDIPYLVLTHEIVSNKKGLLAFYPNENDKLETIPLNVYNPYNYLLHLLQPSGDKGFIVPFTDKKEIGLLKVTLND